MALSQLCCDNDPQALLSKIEHNTDRKSILPTSALFGASGFLEAPLLQEVIENVHGSKRTSSETGLPFSEGQGATIHSDRRLKAPVVWLPTARATVSTSISFQKWEGTVLSVGEDSFQTRLIDMEHASPDEEAEVLLAEVSCQDLPLVKPGAIFYWHIGYHESKVGQRTRESVLRFRRLPVWGKEELGYAKEKAKVLRDLIEWK